MTKGSRTSPVGPVLLVCIGLLMGCIVGGGIIYMRMAAKVTKAVERGYEIGRLSAQIDLMRKDLRAPTVAAINGDISRLRATTAELRYFRHELDPYGVVAWDMYPTHEQQEAAATVAHGANFAQRGRTRTR